MNLFKYRYFRAFVLVLCLLAVFFAGAVFGGRISDKYLAKKFNENKMPVVLAHYKSYRDISRAIESHNYELAKCNSDLNASVMLDALRACFTDENCKSLIKKDVSETASEIEGKAPLEFKYLQTKNGIKVCN